MTTGGITPGGHDPRIPPQPHQPPDYSHGGPPQGGRSQGWGAQPGPGQYVPPPGAQGPYGSQPTYGPGGPQQPGQGGPYGPEQPFYGQVHAGHQALDRQQNEGMAGFLRQAGITPKGLRIGMWVCGAMVLIPTVIGIAGWLNQPSAEDIRRDKCVSWQNQRIEQFEQSGVDVGPPPQGWGFDCKPEEVPPLDGRVTPGGNGTTPVLPGQTPGVDPYDPCAIMEQVPEPLKPEECRTGG